MNKQTEEVISKLRVAMTDARQNESHFESWMILNEAICDAIEALAEQPAQYLSGLAVYLDPNDGLKPKRHSPQPAQPQQELGFYGRAAARLSKRVKELEAQQQEPVAYWIPKSEQFCIASPSGRPFAKAWEPLYTSPQPSKPWVGLTDEDIGNACGFAEHTTASTRFTLMAISRAIEAKLKEKNT